MKFIITESRMERIISKNLDLQDFVKVEKDNYIYFFNSIEDEFFQIKYDIRAHFDVVTDIQFIDSTQMIVSTSEDCLVKLWNIKNI